MQITTATAQANPTVQTVINSSQLTFSRETFALVGFASDFPASFQPGAWPKYITVTSKRTGAQRVYQYKSGPLDRESGRLMWADYVCKQETLTLRIIND